VKYAKPKVSLEKFAFDPHFFLMWVPMVKIVYRTGKKKREMCFDAFTPVKIKITEAFVWLMRNPKHFRVVEGDISLGVILPALIFGDKILEILKRVKAETLRVIEEVGDTLTKISKRYIIQLLSIFPAQYLESRKLKPYEKWIPIFTLIDAIGIDFDTEFISEDLIYWPLLIDVARSEVYEIALKSEPSQSYSHIHKEYDLIKIASEYIREKNE